MKLDYKEIGRRIARRRKQLRWTQAAVEELADLGDKYLSSIETGKSIPSTEVIMRLALALDTTPDEFLVGTARDTGERWREVAELLRDMDDKHLELAGSLLAWLKQQPLDLPPARGKVAWPKAMTDEGACQAWFRARLGSRAPRIAQSL